MYTAPHICLPAPHRGLAVPRTSHLLFQVGRAGLGSALCTAFPGSQGQGRKPQALSHCQEILKTPLRPKAQGGPVPPHSPALLSLSSLRGPTQDKKQLPVRLEPGQAFFAFRTAHTCVHTQPLTRMCSHVCTRKYTHAPLYLCLFPCCLAAAGVNNMYEQGTEGLLTSEEVGGKKVQHGWNSDHRQETNKKSPSSTGEEKLINVSVPLFIKQEFAHKYSQGFKVRSGDSSVNAQQLRRL